jgi:hypothetical protein
MSPALLQMDGLHILRSDMELGSFMYLKKGKTANNSINVSDNNAFIVFNNYLSFCITL